MTRVWAILRIAIGNFIAHEALSRGAAIAFYTATSLSPLLLIVIAIAGLAFGQDLARDSVSEQLSGLVGQEGGDFIKTLIAKSSDPASGAAATTLGVIIIIVAASGIFGEMQAGLNAAWDVKASDLPWYSLVRARAASLGLVAALGFMLIVSLAASTAIAALGQGAGEFVPFSGILLQAINIIVSLAIFTVLFAAIYKVLPDAAIAWRDVLIGHY